MKQSLNTRKHVRDQQRAHTSAEKIPPIIRMLSSETREKNEEAVTVNSRRTRDSYWMLTLKLRLLELVSCVAGVHGTIGESVASLWIR